MYQKISFKNVAFLNNAEKLKFQITKIQNDFDFGPYANCEMNFKDIYKIPHLLVHDRKDSKPFECSI